MVLLRGDYHAVAAILLIEFLSAVSYAVLLLVAVVSPLLPNACGMLVMLLLRDHIVARGVIVVKRGQMTLHVVVVSLANV